MPRGGGGLVAGRLTGWLRCRRLDRMTDAQLLALEIFFIGLLVTVSVIIAYIAYVVVSRLYKGQR